LTSDVNATVRAGAFTRYEYSPKNRGSYGGRKTSPGLGCMGEIHALFDLEPQFQPVLMQVNVRLSEFVDCVTQDGLRAAALPATYPDGVTWVRTRDVGRRAYLIPAANGIACRSAVLSTAEELAIFDRAIGLVRRGKRYAFKDWYPPLVASGLKRDAL
jgi:hypothetical protein